jgi:hypothetical protein
MGVPLPVPSAEAVFGGAVSALLPASSPMSPFSKELAQRALSSMWDSVCSEQDNATEIFTSAGDSSDPLSAQQALQTACPQRVCDDAYRALLLYFTTGENALLGDMHTQLQGRMTRERGGDGSVEWVSVEGRDEWRRLHALTPHSSSSTVAAEAVSSTIITAYGPENTTSSSSSVNVISRVESLMNTKTHESSEGNSIGDEDGYDFSSWLRGVLMDRKVKKVDADADAS